MKGGGQARMDVFVVILVQSLFWVSGNFLKKIFSLSVDLLILWLLSF